MNWEDKLSEEIDKHKALLVVDKACLSCGVSEKLCQPVVLKTRLNFNFLPDHKSIMIIVCEPCGKDPPTTWKIMSNIVKKLIKQNEEN